jgi:hypothetical protein
MLRFLLRPYRQIAVFHLTYSISSFPLAGGAGRQMRPFSEYADGFLGPRIGGSASTSEYGERSLAT